MKVSIKFICFASLLGANGVVAKEGGTSLTAAVPALARATADPAFFRRRSNIINVNSNSNNAKSTATTTAAAVDIIHRGGACSDSDPALFMKIGTTAIFESAALLGIIVSSVKLSNLLPQNFPSVFDLPLLELMASFFVIFGSSFVGALVDGGLSAATNQALNPNQVLGDPNWYANLKKPSWNPPGWLFPIMWLLVSKPTQLCAVSRILKYGIITKVAQVEGSAAVSTVVIPMFALAVYTSHLALGDAWNKVFFGLECIGRGTVVISLFFSVLLASTYIFYNIDPIAGYYMLPTCGWVTVATALQWSIYLKNKK